MNGVFFSVDAIAVLNGKNIKGTLHLEENGLHFDGTEGVLLEKKYKWNEIGYTVTKEKIRKLLFFSSLQYVITFTFNSIFLLQVRIDENYGEDCIKAIERFQKDALESENSVYGLDNKISKDNKNIQCVENVKFNDDSVDTTLFYSESKGESKGEYIDLQEEKGNGTDKDFCISYDLESAEEDRIHKCEKNSEHEEKQIESIERESQKVNDKEGITQEEYFEQERKRRIEKRRREAQRLGEERLRREEEKKKEAEYLEQQYRKHIEEEKRKEAERLEWESQKALEKERNKKEERLEQVRQKLLEEQKKEAERIGKENQRKLEERRLEVERQEQERQRKLEEERRLEAERQRKLEEERRLEAERQEQERQRKLEEERRLEAERQEQERQRKLEEERRQEAEHLEKERQIRLEKRRKEVERLERERQKRIEERRREAERLEKERQRKLEEERRQEAERLEKERQRKLEEERRLEAERQEQERQRKLEEERRLEAERLEKERQKKLEEERRREEERLEKERKRKLEEERRREEEYQRNLEKERYNYSSLQTDFQFKQQSEVRNESYNYGIDGYYGYDSFLPYQDICIEDNPWIESFTMFINQYCEHCYDGRGIIIARKAQRLLLAFSAAKNSIIDKNILEYEYEDFISEYYSVRANSEVEYIVENIIMNALYSDEYNEKLLERSLEIILTDFHENLIHKSTYYEDEYTGPKIYYPKYSYERDENGSSNVLSSLYSELYNYELEEDLVKDINSFATEKATEIIEYVRTQKKPVSAGHLRKHFPSFNKRTILLVFENNSEIINYRRRYFSSLQLDLSDMDKEAIKEEIDYYLESEYVSHIEGIYDLLKEDYDWELSKMFVNNSYELFSVLSVLYKDDFEFKRPFIALKGNGIPTTQEWLQAFVINYNELLLEDVLSYAKEKYLKIPSIIDFIVSISHTMVLKNKYTLMQRNLTGANDSVVHEIDSLIYDELQATVPVKAIRDLTCIVKMPQIAVPWNEWLIFTILLVGKKKTHLFVTSNKYKQAIPVIALNSSVGTIEIDNIANKYLGYEEQDTDVLIDDLDDLDSLIEDDISLEDIEDFDFDFDDEDDE